MALESKKDEPAKVWRQYLSSQKTAQGSLLQTSSLQTSSIGLASTFTEDPLIPYLGGGLIQKGFAAPEFSIAPYNQVYQVCLNFAATLKQNHFDVIIILWRIEDFLEELLVKSLSESASFSALLDEIDSLLSAVGSLRENFDGILIVSTPPYPVSIPQFDIHELDQPAKGVVLYNNVLHRWINGLNEIEGIRILDLNSLLQRAGYVNSHDERKWYLYKQPYTEKFWAYLATQLVRTVAVETLSAKKCVVVDCDNTLWGGIVGEDGISEIVLGEDFPGNAFRDFQKYLLFLKSKGIFLAVASKNNQQDVFDVFDKHDSMVLRKDDICVFQVHWHSKVDSIKLIASRLNISTDALVFVDDNPKEIAEVQQRLPEVSCFMVPEEIAFLPELLKGEGLFDLAEITVEDTQRSQMMVAEQKRTVQREKQTEADFLSSLELEIEVVEAEPEQLTRITQLVNKSNQFNLTTRRKTRQQIEVLSEAQDSHVFSLSVSDRFGQYGLVGVAIVCRVKDAEWCIETLLMSCRVLGRNVETAFLEKISVAVTKFNGNKLCGKYLPTNKNELVKDFYAKHGFVYEDSTGNWEINIEDIIKPETYVNATLRLRD